MIRRLIEIKMQLPMRTDPLSIFVQQDASTIDTDIQVDEAAVCDAWAEVIELFFQVGDFGPLIGPRCNLLGALDLFKIEIRKFVGDFDAR